MSRTARLAALVLSLVMLALGIVGASAQPAIPKLETPVTVKVGFAKGSMSVAGVYVAIAKGYFREAGITNEFVPLASFNAILPAVATGELDLRLDPHRDGEIVRHLTVRRRRSGGKIRRRHQRPPVSGD